MLHWALTAAAVLTLAFAIRVLFASGKQHNAGREKLGIGFSIAACGLWIYVLRHHLGELGPAIRIGAGLLLILPAISALANPARARIVRAIIGVILAVLLAGPAVSDLWQEYGPDTRSKSVRRVEQQLEEASELRGQLGARKTTLQILQQDTKAELKAMGSTWEEIEGNPAAMKQLELLAAVETSLDEVGRALDELDARGQRLTESLERQEGGDVVEDKQADSELERIKRQLEAQTERSDLGIVEQHLQAQKLRELFDEQLDSN